MLKASELIRCTPCPQESWEMAALLLVFILVGSFTVMNMLLGGRICVLCVQSLGEA